MANHLFTVAGTDPVDLDAVADQLRAQIDAGGLPLKAQQLSLQTGVQEYLVVVRDHEDPHIHPEGDLVISVLEGGGYLELSTGNADASAGNIVVVPKGVCHAYFNTAPGDSVLLATFSPINSKDSCPTTGGEQGGPQDQMGT